MAPPVVKQMLLYLCGIGEARGYDVRVDRENGLLINEPRFVARTRWTEEQGLNPAPTENGAANFKVTDEATTTIEDVDTIFSIVLDVHSQRKWDPERDDFYPIRKHELTERANEDVNGEYPVTLRFTEPWLRARRNDAARLFPTNTDNDTGEATDGSGSDSGGDDDDGPAETLQDIAERLPEVTEA